MGQETVTGPAILRRLKESGHYEALASVDCDGAGHSICLHFRTGFSLPLEGFPSWKLESVVAAIEAMSFVGKAGP